ncbi:hypothetical protein PPL_08544 [Heterostelium album PN500]|uniref:F-box domain-containing protein n=1 Tax=Heterostelium pallidum (strain ATCC 26659 / Pp 5 / PN500) TaxID=670386 RepID=D3BJ25_HETP5|nr:hypothetical protein PPL_08544 [Heterostelium album PN500]EFA77905.1 hypothetical protein PPL_08544 [Heterostelium album PN500]|eukprot:XP_020430033.1 hypothetical protein PPL_08544 [Heterostelium album PN500]
MIVNLSHLLLLKIVSYLEENIDKICVSLVCKRLFSERDKYLYFNTDHLNVNISKEIDNLGGRSKSKSNKEAPVYYIKSLFTMKSYRTSLLRSLGQKSNCTLIYGKAIYETDYSVNPYKYPVENIYGITPNITKVEIAKPIDNKYLKEIYGMISNSNVSTLIGISSLSYVLPVNLTSITFNEKFNKALLAGQLPPNLKELIFEWNSIFNQPISAGVLPNTLEKLMFGSYSYFNKPFEPHVLPSSLTYLELGRSYTQTLQVGSLPPNLRVLIHCGSYSKISADESLDNLTALTLFYRYDSVGTLDLSDLPASLTSLDIESSLHLTSSLSPSIRYLSIHNSKYDVDEIFKDRSQYNFEILSVDGYKQESLENLKINELQLRFGKKGSIIREIPFGVETLEFGIDDEHLVKKNRKGIPSSVKKIIFNSCPTINELDFKIPNSVEHVVIKAFYNGFSKILFSSLSSSCSI